MKLVVKFRIRRDEEELNYVHTKNQNLSRASCLLGHISSHVEHKANQRGRVFICITNKRKQDVKRARVQTGSSTT